MSSNIKILMLNQVIPNLAMKEKVVSIGMNSMLSKSEINIFRSVASEEVRISDSLFTVKSILKKAEIID